MSVVVTGGAGFIGSHLCARLLDEGHAVLCVDNLLSGRESNIATLVDRPGFRYLRADCTQPLDLGRDVEAIFHLASPASVVDYMNYPYETAMANAWGTQRLLEVAGEHEARFLFTSTSEIYGDPLEHPQRETYWGNVNSIGPRACYDESKRFGETLVMMAVHYRQTDARLVRIFNTYGPHSRPSDGRIVPNFISQALGGQPLTIYGSGQQTRSLCYVSDTVDGLLRAMWREGTTGQVFNLGNPEEHTVVEYARRIIDLCGSTSQLVYLPLPVDDPTRRQPDITRAGEMLGWQPQVGLEEGLRRTIAWFQEGHLA